MTTFEPIAIVGTSCILPGALSPGELWRNVLEGRDLLADPPPGHWGVDPHSLLRRMGEAHADRVASITGGYVRGFEAVFNPGEFDLIMCLGFFYHTTRHYEMFQHFYRIGARHMILDTEVAPGAGALRPPMPT